ncbi:MAG: gamma-glutamylcyclotransferase family protein [Pseudomonadota bacterium]
MRSEHYFAYGSNLSIARLRRRLPGVEPLATGHVSGFELTFHKVSDVDGSGKCDIAPADVDTFGLIYRVTMAEIAMLDRIEGGYERVELTVLRADGPALRAWSYRARYVDPELRPYGWYHHHVLAGAQAAGLPQSHIERIAGQPTWRDPDRERARRERAIHVE